MNENPDVADKAPDIAPTGSFEKFAQFADSPVIKADLEKRGWRISWTGGVEIKRLDFISGKVRPLTLRVIAQQEAAFEFLTMGTNTNSKPVVFIEMDDVLTPDAMKYRALVKYELAEILEWVKKIRRGTRELLNLTDSPVLAEK